MTFPGKTRSEKLLARFLPPTSSAGVTVIAMTEYVGRIVDEGGTEHGEDRLQGFPQEANLAYGVSSIPIAPEYGNRLRLRIYQEDAKTNRVRLGEFPIRNPLANGPAK
ncbi:MAG: hypothetical protein FJ398_07145 [Verrucomicrobia bacterium]|nr:hypothetical protein [Verrucomicrobiota bacterium]